MPRVSGSGGSKGALVVAAAAAVEQMDVGLSSSISSLHSDTSSESIVSPSLLKIQKGLTATCEEIRVKNVWNLEMDEKVNIFLHDLLTELQQRGNGTRRTLPEQFICDIFEDLQFLLNRFLVPPGVAGYMIGDLCSTLVSTLELTTELCRSSSNLASLLRDNYGILQVAIDLLSPSLKSTDANLVLTALNALTKELEVTWKAPYLYKLIDTLYSYIESSFDDQPRAHLVLQILINLTSRNVSCVLIASENSKSAKVWNRLAAGMQETNGNELQHILIGHFMFIMTNGIQQNEFSAALETIGATLAEVLEPDNFKSTDNAYQQNCVAILEAISDMLYSLAKKFKTINELCELPTVAAAVNGNGDNKPGPSSGSSSSGVSSSSSDQRAGARLLIEGKANYLQFVEQTATKVATFFMQQQQQRRRSGSGILQESLKHSLIRLLIALLPSFIPMKVLQKAYLAGLQIVDKVFSGYIQSFLEGPGGAIEEDGVKLCLQFYIFLAEQLENEKLNGLERANLKEIESLLSKMLGKFDLDSELVSTCAESIEILTSILRLLSTLTKQPTFSEKILQATLKPHAVKRIILSLRSPSNKYESRLSRRSNCIIEILFLMAQYTRDPTIFNLIVDAMSLPDISLHVAKGIQLGDEAVVGKSLFIIGSVGFANISLGSVAKSIVTLRSQQPKQQELSQHPMETDQDQFVFGSHHGVKQVHALIRTVNALDDELQNGGKKSKKDAPTLSNIVACYRLDQQLLEHELAVLNGQIIEAKNMNRSLNSLLKKHRQVIDSLLLEKEKSGEEALKLQARLQKAESEAASANSNSQKELLKLKSDLVTERKSTAALNKTIREQEVAMNKLKDDLNALMEQRDDLNEELATAGENNRKLANSLEKKKEDNEKIQLTCKELEDELATKKKELVSLRAQLEQQMKLVNTIRGVLGNNAFGGMLAQNP